RAALPPNGLSQRHVPLGAKLLLGVGNRAAGACDVRGRPSVHEDVRGRPSAHAGRPFAPLAFQPSAMTNCANQRFLSY
ncbi:unnamed protein product, partial [Brassica napus]